VTDEPVTDEPVAWRIRLTTYEAGLDMGVRGFDSVRGIGGSEPTLPKRREKVGTNHNCQL
jgi:hypothetical protein